jgi:hypothetical protein
VRKREAEARSAGELEAQACAHVELEDAAEVLSVALLVGAERKQRSGTPLPPGEVELAAGIAVNTPVVVREKADHRPHPEDLLPEAEFGLPCKARPRIHAIAADLRDIEGSRAELEKVLIVAEKVKGAADFHVA